MKGATNPLKCLPTDSKREISYPKISTSTSLQTPHPKQGTPFPDRPQKHHQTPHTISHTCTYIQSMALAPRRTNHPTILSKPSSLPKNRKRGRPPSRLDQLGPKKHFAFSYNGIRNERPFFYVHNCDRLRGGGRFLVCFARKDGPRIGGLQ